MSWLQPTERDTEYFAQLQNAEHEQLRRYAQVLAMAARIDSHLLRSLRLRFLPDSSVELELALWFSDVISSRNATGADMYPGVARLLCDELRVDVEQYGRAKDSVTQLTQHWRAAEQLEQTMRWAVLEDDTDTLQQGYQRILHQLQITQGDFEKREIARWAKGALATTLDKEQPLQEATWLYQYVAAALGSPGQWLEQRDVEPLPDNLRMALPEGRPQKIGIRVYPGVLQFVKPDEGGVDVIEVNLPIPTIVQIRFNDGEPMLKYIWYGCVLQIPYIEHVKRIELQTLNGLSFYVDRKLLYENSIREKSDFFGWIVSEITNDLKDPSLKGFLERIHHQLNTLKPEIIKGEMHIGSFPLDIAASLVVALRQGGDKAPIIEIFLKAAKNYLHHQNSIYKGDGSRINYMIAGHTESLIETFKRVLGWLVLASINELALEKVEYLQESVSNGYFKLPALTPTGVEIFTAYKNKRPIPMEMNSERLVKSNMILIDDNIKFNDFNASEIVNELKLHVWRNVFFAKKTDYLTPREINVLNNRLQHYQLEKKTYCFAIDHQYMQSYEQSFKILSSDLPSLLLISFGHKDDQSYFCIRESSLVSSINLCSIALNSHLLS